MPAPTRNRSNRKGRPAVNRESEVQGAESESAVVPMYAGREPPPGIERVGDILRRRRQQRGNDLQQIADYLCIRKGFLLALENSDYDELPPDAYVIGFLRSYAVYLGFDGADAINRYRGEMAGRRRKPVLVLPTPIQEGRTPSGLIMVGAIILAVLIYAAWYVFSVDDRTAVNTPPSLPAAPAAISAPIQASAPVSATVDNGGISVNAPPPAIVGSGISAPAPALPVAPPPVVPATTATATPATTKTPTAAPVPAPTKTQPAATANTTNTTKASDADDTSQAPADDETPVASRLVIRAEKESWVLVTDDKGKALLDHVMKPGETFPVPEQDGLKLTTGNSGGISLLWDGKPLPKLSRQSSILHDVPLDYSKLKLPDSKAQ